MIDTAMLKETTDLRDVAGRYTALKRVAAAEYAAACPVCGGTDRFHVHSSGWWFCRQCHPKRGDVIELVRFVDKLGFTEAVTRLAGDMHVTERRTTPQPKTPSTPVGWTDADRDAANAFVFDAQIALATCKAATDYLHGRGIEDRTWQAFGFGYAEKPAGVGRAFQKPAIVMPWYLAGRLVAIRYRYLEPIKTVNRNGKEEMHKIRSWRGSEFAGVLFGGQEMPPFVSLPLADGEQPIERLRTLLIVEGEINAVSCWQAAHETCLDVLSIGSESAHLSESDVLTASRYGQVFVWADREGVAQRLVGAIPGAMGIVSPGGNDANDLLRTGLLGGFLAMNRLSAATDEDVRERITWQLWDAANILSGVDASTKDVLNEELSRREQRRAR